MSRARGRSNGPVVFVVLLVLAVLELWLLVTVGRSIGAGWTLVALLAQTLAGAWVIRRAGSRAWQAIRGAVERGRAPRGGLTDTSLVMAGGLLLMLPSFGSDLLALVCLVPATRPLVRRAVGALTSRQMARSGLTIDALKARAEGAGTTIEGEVVPDPSPRPSRQRHEDGGDPPAISGTVL